MRVLCPYPPTDFCSFSASEFQVDGNVLPRLAVDQLNLCSSIVTRHRRIGIRSGDHRCPLAICSQNRRFIHHISLCHFNRRCYHQQFHSRFCRHVWLFLLLSLSQILVGVVLLVGLLPTSSITALHQSLFSLCIFCFSRKISWNITVGRK